MSANMVKINGIPAIGYGTYPLAGVAGRTAMEMALEVGFRHIDTAQMYGNEAEVGQAIASSGLKRDEVFVTTKVSPANLRTDTFLASVKQSLDALKLAAVDLLLIHWPPTVEAEIAPLIEKLNQAADQGLAARIGVSNFPIKFMRLAANQSARKLACNQVEFHPLLDQSKLLAAAKDLGVTLSAYCPLARGAVLTHPVVAEIATRMGEPASAIVLAWIIQQGVIPVPMTTKRANAIANLRALSITINPADFVAISSLDTAHSRFVSPSNMAMHWDRS